VLLEIFPIFWILGADCGFNARLTETLIRNFGGCCVCLQPLWRQQEVQRYRERESLRRMTDSEQDSQRRKINKK
jgi:hypothetical protein